MSDSNNALGSRGEAIFQTVISRFLRGAPLFKASFLGEKWPFVDYLCELEGNWTRHRPFFFAQVKATRRGYSKHERRLLVTINQGRAEGLRLYKAPTYLIGIDEKQEKAYVVGVCGSNVGALSSLHCGVELNDTGLRRLHDEVKRFWVRVRRQNNWTMLREPRWL